MIRAKPANGTEGAAFQQVWCDSCEQDRTGECPIILTAISGGQPKQWGRGPNWAPHTTVYCTSYEPRKDS